jgi:hypothetical protein
LWVAAGLMALALVVALTVVRPEPDDDSLVGVDLAPDVGALSRN